MRDSGDDKTKIKIKVLSDEFKTHPEAFISLQRESRKSQRIAHPNIVNVHDFDRDGATVFYDNGRKLVAVGGSYKQSMENCNVTTLNQHNGSADKATGFRVLRELRVKL